MKNIFVTREIEESGIKKLEESGFNVTVNKSESIPSQEDIINFLKEKEYDAVVTLLTDKIDAKIYDAFPNIKLYVNFASGFDNINILEAKEKGITIANAPAVLTAEAVAEHTMALMLSLTARIVEADQFVRDGKYKGWMPNSFIGTDVLGKTLGLVGAGRIGSKVGYYSKGMGMKVVYYDLQRNEALEKECGGEFVESLEELLKRADIVSIHVPLMDSTRHLINKEKLSLMKKEAILINTSRGPVVDETALVEALKSGIIGGAGLDVFEFEPNISPELIKLQNVVLTPHIASASIEARKEMSDIVAKNIIEYFEGKEPTNKVNK